MSFINKIKLNYNIKVIDDLIINKNQKEIISSLRKIKHDNPEVFFQILSHYINKQSADIDLGINFHTNQSTFINSFQIEDTNYLKNFFKYYFEKIGFDNHLDYFSNSIAGDLNTMQLTEFSDQIDFDQMVNFSNFFINSLLVKHSNKDCFFISNSAFFESKEKQKYFIYPDTTKAYFLIHKNPIKMLCELKAKFGDTQSALNEMFNFENKLILNNNSSNDYEVFENRQSWNIYNQSWTDPNVLSAYRGLLINYDEFVHNSEETLTKIIFHLIDAGLDIDINYDVIRIYVEENTLEPDNLNIDLSNKEKKLLLNNVDNNLLETFNYTI